MHGVQGGIGFRRNVRVNMESIKSCLPPWAYPSTLAVLQVAGLDDGRLQRFVDRQVAAGLYRLAASNESNSPRRKELYVKSLEPRSGRGT